MEGDGIINGYFTFERSQIKGNLLKDLLKENKDNIVIAATKVQKAGAEMPHGLCLSDHASKWKMEIFLAVDRDIPEAKM